MFPGTPAPIPIPCWALRSCSSPGIITCRVKAGAWGQPGAGHSMDLSLSPPRVLSPPVSLPSTSSSVLVLAATDANCSMIYVWREQDIDASCHPSIGLTSLKYW